MKKKRILVINSERPYPIYDGGIIRTVQMLKMLSKEYIVDLAYVYDGNDIAKYNGELDMCNQVFAFKLPKIQALLQTMMGFFFSKLPLQIFMFYSPKLQRFVNKHVSDYDFVFCNNIRTTRYLLKINCTKTVDFVDAISMNYAKAKKYANPLWKLLYAIESRRCLFYEQRLLREFDKHIIISAIDAQYIQKGTDRPIKVIPNSRRLANRSIDHVAGNHNLIFVGSMFYTPNIVAVKLFCRNIFPLIQKKYSDAKFYIVGARPPVEVKHLASPAVKVTGFVDSPLPYLYDAAVSVVPMYSGAGLQNKILESMALGGCVVTTTIGAEGLVDYENGKQLYVCSSDIQFAECVNTLLYDVELRNNMGQAARQYVQDHYSFENIAKTLNTYMSI